MSLNQVSMNTIAITWTTDFIRNPLNTATAAIILRTLECEIFLLRQ